MLIDVFLSSKSLLIFSLLVLVICWEKSVEVTICNCGFGYFSFQSSKFLCVKMCVKSHILQLYCLVYLFKDSYIFLMDCFYI